MNLSASKAASLVPFGYFAVTRLTRLRDVGYLVATSWLPAAWLAFRLAEIGLAQAVGLFILGYLAFISLYEIGYLANDAWDAKRAEDSRPRISFDFGPPFVTLFLTIRIAAWSAVGIWTGWIFDAAWQVGYAALAIAFAQHNIIQRKSFRIASFFELAILRFLLPVVAILPRPSIPAAAMVTVLLYAYLRLLGYMDSKAILALDERRRPDFGFWQILSIAPVTIGLAIVAQMPVMIELLVYYLLVFGAWWAMADRMKLEKP